MITGREATPIYVTKTKRKFHHWKWHTVKTWKNAGSFVGDRPGPGERQLDEAHASPPRQF